MTAPRPTPAPWLVIVRIAALIALGASGALLADYTGTAPTYCTAGSGCAAIRQAGWGYVPGVWIPVPAVGALAFAALLLVSLLKNAPLARKLTAWGALAAGVIGAALLVVQAVVIGVFCTLCVLVDGSAIVAAVAGALMLRDRARPELEPLSLAAWSALGALAFLAPWYWPKARPAPDVPAEIQKLYVPGKVNVVEFADFECPYCRMLHDTLKKLNQEYAGRVHFVRLNMPLASHPHARGAARAFVCADAQGKGERMGDLLFEEQLFDPAGQRRAAEKLGLDLESFDRCLTARETDERIDREARILRDSGFEGLPTTYVGSEKLLGAQPEEVFRSAYERAARGVGQRGVPLPIYALVALGLAGATVWIGRRRGAEPDPKA